MLPPHAIYYHGPKSFQVSIPRGGNMETFLAIMETARAGEDSPRKVPGFLTPCLARPSPDTTRLRRDVPVPGQAGGLTSRARCARGCPGETAPPTCPPGPFEESRQKLVIATATSFRLLVQPPIPSYALVPVYPARHRPARAGCGAGLQVRSRDCRLDREAHRGCHVPSPHRRTPPPVAVPRALLKTTPATAFHSSRLTCPDLVISRRRASQSSEVITPQPYENSSCDALQPSVCQCSLGRFSGRHRQTRGRKKIS